MIGQLDRIIELQQLSLTAKTKQPNKIVCIASGKGGTGKTVFAVNLAYMLAKNKKKVLLVDLDFNLANVHILLNENPVKTIGSFFNYTSPLLSLINNYKNTFDIIFGDSNKSNYKMPGLALIDLLIEKLSELSDSYDAILIDCGAGASDQIVSLLNQSSFNIIVTTPEPTAIMDAYSIIKLVKHNNAEMKNYIVVNKSIDDEEGNTAFTNLNKALKHFLKIQVPLLAVLHEDRDIRASVISQNLFVEIYPASKLTKQFELATDRFIKIIQLFNINQSSFIPA